MAEIPTAESEDDELVEIGVAARITGLSPSTIRRKIQNPQDDYPRPLDVGTTRRKWFRRELRQWRADKIAAREQGRAS